MSELPTTHAASRNLGKTLIAAIWMYGGRGVGMVWTLALISQLSIADYGLYGMGFALASIIGPPLDNPFAVRAARESQERFLAERTTRYLLGLALMAAGVAFVDVNYIAWFGLFVAGGEIVFRVYQSQAFRDGHPERVWRIDTIQRTACMVIACAYLFGAPHPTLHVASLLYCTPYVAMACLVGVTVLRRRPGMPGPPRLFAVLVGETLGLAAYMQGDVLLLGWLTNNTTVGYYTITVVVTFAIASIGQSYGMSYHESLRERDGDRSAGPPLRTTLLIGVAAGLLVSITGVVLLISPAPTELAVAMLVMAVFCAMRAVSLIFQVVLYTQRRDMIRLTTNLGLVPVKLALVAALASAGAVGAAIATVVTDAILLAVYATAVYRKAKR